MRYIVIMPAIAMGAMALIMLLMIHILSSVAVEYDIKQELIKDIKHNLRYIQAEEDGYTILDGFSYRDDSVYFLFVDKNGRVLDGAYPDPQLKKIPIGRHFSQSVVCNGEKYYMRDVRVSWNSGERSYLRAVVSGKDADSRYRTVEWVSYLSIFGIFAGILCGELLLSRRISRQLKQMCEVADSVGKDLDLSKRMDEDNRIREIAVLAQANNRMLDRMEQMFAQQEQFTSDVAHELRTPVAVTMAQCQYARGRLESREETEEALDVIHRQSAKINSIITQLLIFSRLEQGRVQLEEELLDFAEIVPSVCEDEQDKAGSRVTIEMQLEEVCTKGDIALISIVIQNLVDNAVKFSRDGGKVLVKAGKRDGMAFVSVQDWGIGIAPEDTEKIFQRFYKCDKSRNAEGFGLGLSLSARIAQKHHGTVTVESVPGEGSIFTLLLPL